MKLDSYIDIYNRNYSDIKLEPYKKNPTGKF